MVLQSNLLSRKRELVSVIIPVLTDSKGLAESLRSVFNQTYQDWELILVCERSLPALPKEYQIKIQNHPGINVISSPSYTFYGLPYCLNRGIEESKGKYITFLNPLDIWMPKRLERAVNFIELNDAKAIFSGSLVQGKNAVYFKDYKETGIKNSLIDHLFTKDSFKSLSTLMLETSIAKNCVIDETMSQFADFDLMMAADQTTDWMFFDNSDLIEHWITYNPENIDLLSAIRFYKKYKHQSLDKKASIGFLIKLVKSAIQTNGSYSEISKLRQILMEEGVGLDSRLKLAFTIPKVIHYYSKILNGLSG